jgi:acyl-CoA synthetase (AMP-forming)/AMP-acid ligase II
MGLWDVTIQDVIKKNALLCKDEVAFVCGEKSWTFDQYASEVDLLASGLASLGVEKGDRIGVLAFNCYEFFLFYGAVARLGAILLPINWRLKPEEIQVILGICTPKVIVADPEYADMMGTQADRCTFEVHRLLIGKGGNGFRPLHELMESVGMFEEVDVVQQDPFIILPTAAVEGKPKGAVLTHQNLIAANLQNMALMCIQGDDVHLNVMPLFHIMGIEIAFSVLHAGGLNVIMNRFDSQEAGALIEKMQVTIIPTVPPMLSSILDQAEASGLDLRCLRVVAGLAEDPETIGRLQEVTGAKFWVGFGQSETTGYIALCPHDDRPGSSGKEGLLARIRVVDDYDEDVEIGQPGEVVVRGPLVFKGYWNSEDDTSYTFRERWHHTGDIGRLDEKGYLWYVKRKAEKELIKPGGENVYPAEVEKTLLEHSDVLEACVFGIPDKEWGEAVKAVCRRKTDSTLGVQKLIDFVGSRIARYKKPKYITFVEALPKTEDGKMDREKVKAEHTTS